MTFINISSLSSYLESERIVIVGKGPSSGSHLYDLISPGADVIGINEIVKIHRVHFAFFIDIEPLLRSQSEIIKFKPKLILPAYFNKLNSLGQREEASLKLEESIEDCLSWLRNYPSEIFVFDTGLSEEIPKYPVFKPNFVSASALLEIVYTYSSAIVVGLGFDGGNQYSLDLSKSDIKTSVKDFSTQFEIFKGIDRIYQRNFKIMKTKQINVYVGATEEQDIPFKVLEYSIISRTNADVNIIRLDKAIVAAGLSMRQDGATPFSLQRLFIPKLNGYSGVAVYLDSDMLVFDDIENLVKQHDHNFTLCSCPAPPGTGRRDQYSVFTVDCEKANWDASKLLSSKIDYKSLMFDFSFESSKSKCIDWRWNSLEYYDENISLIHFTDMDKQPWISKINPLRQVWLDVFNECRVRKIIDELLIQEHVEKGYILEELYSSSFYIKLKGFFYLPPHTLRRFPNFSKGPLKIVLALLIRLKRTIYRKYEK